MWKFDIENPNWKVWWFKSTMTSPMEWFHFNLSTSKLGHVLPAYLAGNVLSIFFFLYVPIYENSNFKKIYEERLFIFFIENLQKTVEWEGERSKVWIDWFLWFYNTIGRYKGIIYYLKGISKRNNLVNTYMCMSN